MLKGIDISNWQAGLIPHELGVDFCIAKATEGTYFVDPYCDEFIQDCISHGMLWGFYHFAGTTNPVNEADFFINNTVGYDKQGIPVLDYEVWGETADDVAWCEKFLKRYHDVTGVWPVLYISASHCADFAGSWVPEKCGLWVAGYPQDYWAYPDAEMPYSISPWEFCAIWQFTSGLQMKGWALDGDYAYMDRTAWGRYAGVSTKDEKPVENPAEGKKTITGRVTIELD